MFTIKVCRWLDSKCGPLVLEAIALPADLQPLPLNVVFWTSIMKIEFHFLLFNQPSYYILIRTHFNRAIALAPRKGEGGGGHRGTIHEQCDQMLVWKVRPSFSKKLPKKKPLQFLLQKNVFKYSPRKIFWLLQWELLSTRPFKSRPIRSHCSWSSSVKGEERERSFFKKFAKKVTLLRLGRGREQDPSHFNKMKIKSYQILGKMRPFLSGNDFFYKRAILGLFFFIFVFSANSY